MTNVCFLAGKAVRELEVDKVFLGLIIGKVEVFDVGGTVGESGSHFEDVAFEAFGDGGEGDVGDLDLSWKR